MSTAAIVGVDLGDQPVTRDNLRITILESRGDLEDTIRAMQAEARSDIAAPVAAEAAEHALTRAKFAACVPRDIALASLRRRLSDPAGVTAVLSESMGVLRHGTDEVGRQSS